MEVKFDKKKYETLYDSIDDKNKVILYLLSKDRMDMEALCQLKISDINERGLGSLELPRREQAALARYLKAGKAIESMEEPVFPGRGKQVLTPQKLKMSFVRICKKAGIEPAEVGVTLSERKREDINESNVNMEMILDIIQEKLGNR